jgi:cbb3-type cytochrome oxidase subunit 3
MMATGGVMGGRGEERNGSGYAPVLFWLAICLGVGIWFITDRSACRKRFDKAATAYDTLLIADTHNCGFAVRKDIERIRGQMTERCHNRGGYWLDKPVQIGTTQTLCLEGPRPILLTQPESPK